LRIDSNQHTDRLKLFDFKRDNFSHGRPSPMPIGLAYYIN